MLQNFFILECKLFISLRFSMKSNTKNLLFVSLLFSLAACNNHQSIQQKEVVASADEINAKAEALLKNTLEDLVHRPSPSTDSLKIKNAALVQKIYEKNNFQL